MTKLAIASDLSLPLDVATEVLGFLGRRGQGKSYAAQKLAELFHEAHAQFVAIDPVGIWWGLRLAADGKSPGLPIPVLGGLHGDVPLEPTAGKVIADLVVDKGISVVIDVSQFESDAQKARFASDFASRFFFRKKAAPSAVHVFLEECQEFVPQHPQSEETRMLHDFTRMAKIGRNFGIGLSLISLRPQEVNKKVLNLIEVLFAFQLTGPHERKAVEGWIQEKGLDEDIRAELPKLQQGKPHVWSPGLLQMSRVVSIGKKWTFDASSTPKVGAGAKAHVLGSIDIEQLGADIKATVEKAKAEDPKELRKQLVERDREIALLKKTPAATRTVEKPVVDQAAIDRAVNKALSNVYERQRTAAAHVRRALARMNAIGHEITELADPAIARLDVSFIEQQGLPSGAETKPNAVAAETRQTASGRQHERRPAASLPRASSPRGDLSKGQQKILNALAEFEAIGVDQTTRHQLGMMAGYNLTGGTGAQHIADLVAAGLAEIPDKGSVRLTDEGRAAADAEDTPTTLSDLHERVLRKLPDGQRRIAEYLIQIYPDAISRADLGAAVGYNLTGGTGAQHVADLVTVGAARIPNPGKVVASDLLFPEGLS